MKDPAVADRSKMRCKRWPTGNFSFTGKKVHIIIFKKKARKKHRITKALLVFRQTPGKVHGVCFGFTLISHSAFKRIFH